VSQPRCWNGHGPHIVSNQAVQAFRRRTPSCRFVHTADDSLGVGAFGAAQLLDCPGHIRLAVSAQQLQDTNVLPCSIAAAVPIFQARSQLAER